MYLGTEGVEGATQGLGTELAFSHGVNIYGGVHLYFASYDTTFAALSRMDGKRRGEVRIERHLHIAYRIPSHHILFSLLSTI